MCLAKKSEKGKRGEHLNFFFIKKKGEKEDAYFL